MAPLPTSLSWPTSAEHLILGSPQPQAPAGHILSLGPGYSHNLTTRLPKPSSLQHSHSQEPGTGPRCVFLLATSNCSVLTPPFPFQWEGTFNLRSLSVGEKRNASLRNDAFIFFSNSLLQGRHSSAYFLLSSSGHLELERSLQAAFGPRGPARRLQVVLLRHQDVSALVWNHRCRQHRARADLGTSQQAQAGRLLPFRGESGSRKAPGVKSRGSSTVESVAGWQRRFAPLLVWEAVTLAGPWLPRPGRCPHPASSATTHSGQAGLWQLSLLVITPWEQTCFLSQGGLGEGKGMEGKERKTLSNTGGRSALPGDCLGTPTQGQPSSPIHGSIDSKACDSSSETSLLGRGGEGGGNRNLLTPPGKMSRFSQRIPLNGKRPNNYMQHMDPGLNS